MRFVVMVLAALPLATASLTLLAPAQAGSLACPHGGGDAPHKSPCPCCDKMVPTGAATCGLSCYAGVEASAPRVRALRDSHRVAFGAFDQYGEGLVIEPQLPPPR